MAGEIDISKTGAVMGSWTATTVPWAEVVIRNTTITIRPKQPRLQERQDEMVDEMIVISAKL